MGQPYKRQRIKTGPNTWINVTQRSDGTIHRSVSNKAGNTTTNVSSRGVRKTQTNNGWSQRSFWSGKQKKSSKGKSSSFKWSWPTSTKKTAPVKFDADKFVEAAERFEKSKANAENWTKGEWTAFIIITTVIITIIQLVMR